MPFKAPPPAFFKRPGVLTIGAQIHAKGGYFLEEDVGAFDVSFFNMSADAAAAMDPQLRLQLEVTFEALESGSYPLFPCARCERKEIQN